MKKVLIVILESTILTLFFTMMSQASSIAPRTQSGMNCRGTLSNLEKCAKTTAIAHSFRVKLGHETNIFKVTP